LALTMRRDTLAGGMLGAAAAFKATPLLWLVYLVLCRRLRAAVVLTVTFAILSLLPDLFWPSPDGKFWIQRWLEQFVLPTQSLTADVGKWWSNIIYNQSLGGLLQRLLNLDMPLPDSPPGRDDLVLSIVLKPITLLLLLVIAGISFLAARHSRRSLPVRPPEAEGLEYGIVIAMMLLASPMSSPAHFVALVLPAFALAGNAARTGSLWSWGLLGLAAAVGAFTHKDLLGNLYSVLLWYGDLTWVTLALWLGAVIALFRTSSAAPSAPAR
jgi:alpha-1,2-mannosyltransferase